MSGRVSMRAGVYWQPKEVQDGPAIRVGGAPESYEALVRDFHGVVMGIAAKAGLHGQDAEDAAQTIELRFWLRGGLADYDPERLFEPPTEGWSDGREAVARPARFATMFKTFVIMSMRGERDRALRWYQRHVSEEETPELGDDPSEGVCRSIVARQWVSDASEALAAAGQPEWAAALVEASEGHLEKREDWVRVLGCKVKSCRWAQEQLAFRLEGVGYGRDSLLRT